MTGGDPSAEEVRALAAQILRQSLHLKARESVTIECWPHALGWADALVEEARRIGARPLVLYESESAFWDLLHHGAVQREGSLGRSERGAIEGSDAWVYLPGPAGRPKGPAELAKFNRILDEWDDAWFGLSQPNGIRACRVELAGATDATAAFYGVDLRTWRTELLDGSRIAPTAFRSIARPLVRRLERGRRLLITHPNGTHLELGLKNRAPTVQDGEVSPLDLQAGRMMTVLPSGVVIVALDERVGHGTLRSNRPSTHYRGTFEEAHWRFDSGRLVEHSAVRAPEVFESAFAEAGRERDRPALFSIGLNPKMHMAPLFEDYQAGVVTVYVGRNADYGGRSRGEYRDYALLEGADVTIDDRPVVRGGRIL